MIKVTLSPLNCVRKTEMLLRSGIRAKRLTCKTAFSFLVKRKYLPTVRSIFPEAEFAPIGWEAVVCLLAKWGVVTGLVMAVVVATAFSLFTTGFSVRGAELYEDEIRAYLYGEGYGALRTKSSVNANEIETSLMQKFPLSIASVTVRGSTVDVLVKEELVAGSALDITEKSDVVSAYDGVVTRLVVKSGTALVHKGSAVRKGQVLVDNTCVIGEQSLPVRADAEVFAKVAFRASKTVGKTALTYERSGRTESASWTKVFALENARKPSFAKYEVEKKLVRTGDIMPIYAVYATFYELMPSEVAVDWQGEVEVAMEELRAELEQRLPFGAKKIDFFCTNREIFGRIEVCATLEAEIIISERVKGSN